MNKKFLYKRGKKIKIRLSSPFLVRTKCKACLGAPSIYYYSYNPTPYVDPLFLQKAFAKYASFIKKMGSDYYLDSDPSEFDSLIYFSQSTGFKRFNPKLHRTRGCKTEQITEYLSCECGMTHWAFTEKAIKNRPEITSRKARHNFPYEFDF